MRLESVLDKNVTDSYSTHISEHISYRPAIRRICSDILNGTSPAVVSAKFHNTLIEAAVKVVQHISLQTGIKKIVLSGGSFQNKYLLSKLEQQLKQKSHQVFTHSQIPCNDGGIALGQLAVAGKRLETGKI